MTITVVCDVLGEENNGQTIAAMNLIRFLKSRGHNIRILCSDADKKGQEGYYIVPSYNFGKLINAYVKKVGVKIAKPDESVIRNAVIGSDVVHIMTPLGLGIATIKVVKELGIPVTAGFHMQAENLTCYIKMNKLGFVNHYVYKFIYNKLYKFVDGIHYPTNFIKNIFESHIKAKTPAYVISNGVHSYVQKRESQKPKQFENKILILSTGRYAREKSQDTLIKAMKYSKHKNDIQIILAGQGVKEKYYRKLAKKVGVSPIFKLFGRNEIIDVLNYCDLYVHPAEAELEGIACLEAIACGKLTIVSDSKLSATREFAIDEKCVFKNRNPKDLARVIDYWIENPEEKKKYEKLYLQSANTFNQDECMKKMEKMLFEVVDAKKESRKEN